MNLMSKHYDLIVAILNDLLIMADNKENLQKMLDFCHDYSIKL